MVVGMSIVLLLLLGVALLLTLIVVELMEVAVFVMAALIIMSASAVYLELASVFQVFATLGLGILVLLAALFYRAGRHGASPTAREVGTNKDGA
jgi:hypothetical protein